MSLGMTHGSQGKPGPRMLHCRGTIYWRELSRKFKATAPDGLGTPRQVVESKWRGVCCQGEGVEL